MNTSRVRKHALNTVILLLALIADTGLILAQPKVTLSKKKIGKRTYETCTFGRYKATTEILKSGERTDAKLYVKSENGFLPINKGQLFNSLRAELLKMIQDSLDSFRSNLLAEPKEVIDCYGGLEDSTILDLDGGPPFLGIYFDNKGITFRGVVWKLPMCYDSWLDPSYPNDFSATFPWIQINKYIDWVETPNE